MLADDSAKFREMTKSLLAGLGAEFVECADGREALAAYGQHQPDWVLMDLMTPGVDGLTATRQITTAFPRARVLVVTQFDGEALRAAAREAGACAYVLKENLLQVRQLIGVQPGVHPIPASPRNAID